MGSAPRDSASADAWLNVPNALSLARIAGAPLLWWLIISERRIVATVLLGVMGITDYLDGWIARRTGNVTRLGTLLDPVSDRVLVMGTIVVLMVARPDGSPILPLWLGAPVLARDAVLSLVFLALAKRGFGSPKVKRVGKTATFALLSSLPALTLGGWLRAPGLVVFAFGGVLYFVAAYRYWQDIQAWLDEQRRSI